MLNCKHLDLHIQLQNQSPAKKKKIKTTQIKFLNKGWILKEKLRMQDKKSRLPEKGRCC